MYNLSNRKLNKVIFELVCTQFVNDDFTEWDGADYSEEVSGPLTPTFVGNWDDTLQKYHLHLDRTVYMIGWEI